MSLNSACLGLVVGFGLMFAKFVIGAAGAGDVKIVAAIGAWVGPLAVLQVFLLYQVLGIAVVIFQAWRNRRLTLLLRNSMVLTASVLHLKAVGRERLIETGHESRSLDHYMPDAVPILAAVLCVLALNVCAG
ncbi:MAG: A24 family peptidase [Tepidisphaeraceae bacterium]